MGSSQCFLCDETSEWCLCVGKGRHKCCQSAAFCFLFFLHWTFIIFFQFVNFYYYYFFPSVIKYTTQALYRYLYTCAYLKDLVILVKVEAVVVKNAELWYCEVHCLVRIHTQPSGQSSTGFSSLTLQLLFFFEYLIPWYLYCACHFSIATSLSCILLLFPSSYLILSSENFAHSLIKVKKALPWL